MTLLTTDTTITYPDGATTSTGTVIHVELLSDGLSAVLPETTAFHPVDTAWPDQRADHDSITTEAQGTQAVGDIARIDIDVAHRAALSVARTA